MRFFAYTSAFVPLNRCTLLIGETISSIGFSSFAAAAVSSRHITESGYQRAQTDLESMIDRLVVMDDNIQYCREAIWWLQH